MMCDDDASFYAAADADVDAAVLSKTTKEPKKKIRKKGIICPLHCFMLNETPPGTTVLRLFATPSSLDSIVASFDSRFVQRNTLLPVT